MIVGPTSASNRKGKKEVNEAEEKKTKDHI